MKHTLAVAFAAAAAVLLSVSSTHAQLAPRIDPKIEVAPHRAVYQMTLASAKSSSGIVSASGVLAFEWGDSCDGWTVAQRYKIVLVASQPGSVEIATSYATWESKDGLKYRFKSRKTRDGKAEEEVSGEARLPEAGKPGKADFTLPQKQTMNLPAGTVFPTEHTLVLMARALAGDTVVRRVVFDGATADGPAEVNALVGRKLAIGQAGVEKLVDHPGWNIRMAYFSLDKTTASEPDYEISMELQDNGIARGLKLDYADFSIKGTLEKVELLPKPAC